MSISRIKVSVALVFCANFVYAAGKPPAATPELLKKGEASYKTNCMVCHGEKGDGKGPAGPSLTPKPRNFVTEKFLFGGKREEVFATITNGSKNKNTAMTSFKHLSEEERWGLADYVLSLKKK